MHLTCTHSAVGLVSSHASFPICASSLPHDLPTIVSLVPAQQQWPNFQSRSQFFPPPAARLSLASSFACGGPRRAIFGQLFWGGVFLLQDSSRPARRTAKAWCLRPARGTAPRGSLGHARVCCTSDKECRRRRHHRRRRRRPSRPTHRLRPCHRSEAAPLAALATQAALRPRSMVGHPIGLLCSLRSAVPWCQRSKSKENRDLRCSKCIFFLACRRLSSQRKVK